jgi:hypothetical protein
VLSSDRQRDRDAYTYKGGMLNIADVVGRLRDVDGQHGLLQFDNVVDHSIPFSLRPRENWPKIAKRGSMIKLRGRVLPDLDGTERILRVEALGIDTPSVIDLPARDVFLAPVRPGQNIDPLPAKAFRPSQSADRFRPKGSRNSVELAGFLVGMKLQRPGAPKPDGGRNDGLLILGIRQSADPDAILPVRVYGPRCVAMAAALRMGDPLYIAGKIEVRLKNVGEPDPETKVYQTAKYPFIRAAQLAGAQPGVHLKIETPDWAAQLQEEAESQAGARQARVAREAMADGHTEASVVSESTPAGALEESAPAIDLSVLSALRGAPSGGNASTSR